MEQVKKEWEQLMHFYQASSLQIQSGWEELVAHYESPKRAYHNFTHLAKLLALANEFSASLSNSRLLKWSIFYHDIIYKPLRKDNESKSAELAVSRLSQLGLHPSAITIVDQQIRSTAGHQVLDEKEPDNPWFLDFDLEILSRSWEEYEEYTQQIRREYQVVPDIFYRKGRKKVLAHFIEKPSLYFTPYFKEHKERQARQNVEREIKSL